MKKIPLIIDTDPGSDDAIALAFAFFHEDFDIKLITTVSGNCDIKKVTENTCHLIDVFNRCIPVVAGAERPLIKKPEFDNVFSSGGLGAYVYDSVFTSKPTPGKVTDHMRRVIFESREKVTILALAPLTNIANLFNTYPECKDRIERIIIMGGSTEGKGNITPYGEFNFYVDPHAAQIVFNSGVKLDVCPIEQAAQLIKKDDLKKMSEFGKTGELVYDLIYAEDNNIFESIGYIYDAYAFMYLANPAIFKTQPAHIGIELHNKERMGQCLCDLKTKQPNCTVVTSSNKKMLRDYFFELLKLPKTQKEQCRPIIVDTDPGVDDSMAIMYALNSPEVRTHLFTVACGNGDPETVKNNCLHLVEIFRRKTPVAEGAKLPLTRKPAYALKAQGVGGLGGYTYNATKNKLKPLNEIACDAIYNTLQKNSHQHTTILSIGPMTNIALMLQKYPDAKKYIRKIVFMGGSKEKLYGKPYKEFNIGFDPEAAKIVIDSGVPLVMIPMELGHFAYLNPQDIARVKNTNKTGKIFAKMFTQYHDFHVGSSGAAVHDAAAMCYLLHPEFIKTEKASLDIKYWHDNDGTDFGYIDFDFCSKTPNALVAVDIDIDKFKSDFFECLNRCL